MIIKHALHLDECPGAVDAGKAGERRHGLSVAVYLTGHCPAHHLEARHGSTTFFGLDLGFVLWPLTMNAGWRTAALPCEEMPHANLHGGCIASKWGSLEGETMASAKDYQAKAEAQFHKTIKKAHDAKQALSPYELAARATDEKTAKLRALRLAKEAAQAEAAEAIAAAENKAAKTKPTAKDKTISKKGATRES
jgi:hypothetical protein